MSRVGKPIPVPSGVDVKIDGSRVAVRGSRGSLERTFPDRVSIAHEDGQLSITRGDDQRQSRALHGLSRALLNNMVVGFPKASAESSTSLGSATGRSSRIPISNFNSGTAIP